MATDPAPDAERKLKAFIDRAAPQLATLGLNGNRRAHLRGHDLEEAVGRSGFRQENAPENEAFKRELLARIDGTAPPDALSAISTSALLRSRIVADCTRLRSAISWRIPSTRRTFSRWSRSSERTKR